jgi:hypothetical protein
MKTRLYSICDEVADECGPLFQAKNDAVAFRNFQSFIVSNKLQEEDYMLRFVAVFDTEKGEVEHPEDIYIVSPTAVAKSMVLDELKHGSAV